MGIYELLKTCFESEEEQNGVPAVTSTEKVDPKRRGQSGQIGGAKSSDRQTTQTTTNQKSRNVMNLKDSIFPDTHDNHGRNVRYSDCGVGPSDNNARNWNNNGDAHTNRVKDLLDQLGLGRYATIFEIHEVDDEVLQMLTMEDLKDMGIDAVGSRRKIFDSIQKLGTDFRP